MDGDLEPHVQRAGAALLRGVPLAGGWSEAWLRAELKLRPFGELVSQDGRGTRHHLINASDQATGAGAHHAYAVNREAFEPHTDGAFLPEGKEVKYVVLLCVSPAASGGQTQLLEARRLLDWLKQHRPAAARRLWERFPFAAMGAGPPHDPDQVTWAPVFAGDEAEPRCRLHRLRILTGCQALGRELDSQELSALEAMGSAFEEVEAIDRFEMRSGDMLILDNQRMLHGRTAYRDSATATRRLIRAWLR